MCRPKILVASSASQLLLKYCQENVFIKNCYVSQLTLQQNGHIYRDVSYCCSTSLFVLYLYSVISRENPKSD